MAGSRWRTTAMGRAWVRIGAALRAIPARLSTRPCCGCRGASSSRRPIRAPMIRRLPRIYSPGFFVFAGKVVHAQGQSPFEIAPPSPQWENLLNGFGWLRHLRVAENPMATHECANARYRFPPAAPEQRRPGLGRPCRGATAHVLDQRLALSARRRGSRLLSSFHAEPSPTMPAICSSGFRAAFRWKTVSFRRSPFAPWPSPRMPKPRLAAPRDPGARPARSGGASWRMAATSADRRAPSSTSSSTFLPLRHLFLAKNQSPPSSCKRRSPAACRSFASCGSATEISACFTAWATCRPIRSPSSFATSRPPASRSSARRFELRALGGRYDGAAHGCRRPAPFCLFAGGACERARLRVFRWPVARGRELRRAHHRLERGPRGGAPHGCSFDARHRGHVLLPFRSEECADRSRRRPSSSARPRRKPCGRRVRPERGSTAMHHGYARRFGLLHERGLALSPDGATVHGLDALLDADPKRPAGGVPFALRFHLHPDVRCDARARGCGRQARSSERCLVAFRSRRATAGARGKHLLCRPRRRRGGPGRSSSRLSPPPPARSPGASPASGVHRRRRWRRGPAGQRDQAQSVMPRTNELAESG